MKLIEPGEIEFSQPVYVVKESVGTFEVQVDRKNGADGQVSVAFKTTEINAIADKDYICNYKNKIISVLFELLNILVKICFFLS